MDSAIRSCILMQAALLIGVLHKRGCLQRYVGQKDWRPYVLGGCFGVSVLLLLFCSSWFLPYAVCMMMMVLNYACLVPRDNHYHSERKLFWMSVALLVPILVLGVWRETSRPRESVVSESAGMQQLANGLTTNR